MSKGKILGNSYVPIFPKDYHKLPWDERDLMAYFDHLDYNEMSDNPTKYFHGQKVINFDIIHHECREGKLSNSYKHYKTVMTLKIIQTRTKINIIWCFMEC